eukprot:GFYU01009702.1.p1 GENE.GFYU01009702.1~~GFYU01009702.1.p1  ORF type:complete len:995 (-),score=239.72 GFYU01009702.1:99-3083(-)
MVQLSEDDEAKAQALKELEEEDEVDEGEDELQTILTQTAADADKLEDNNADNHIADAMTAPIRGNINVDDVNLDSVVRKQVEAVESFKSEASALQAVIEDAEQDEMTMEDLQTILRTTLNNIVCTATSALHANVIELRRMKEAMAQLKQREKQVRTAEEEVVRLRLENEELLIKNDELRLQQARINQQAEFLKYQTDARNAMLVDQRKSFYTELFQMKQQLSFLMDKSSALAETGDPFRIFHTFQDYVYKQFLSAKWELDYRKYEVWCDRKPDDEDGLVAERKVMLEVMEGLFRHLHAASRERKQVNEDRETQIKARDDMVLQKSLEIADLKRDRYKQAAKVKKYKDKIKDFHNTVTQTIETSTTVYLTKIRQNEKRITHLSKEQFQNSKAIAKFEVTKRKYEAEAKEMINTIESREKTISDLKAEMDGLNTAAKEDKEHVEAMTSDLRSANRTIDHKEADIVKLKGTIATQENKMASLRNKLRSVEFEMRTRNLELMKLKDDIVAGKNQQPQGGGIGQHRGGGRSGSPSKEKSGNKALNPAKKDAGGTPEKVATPKRPGSINRKRIPLELRDAFDAACAEHSYLTKASEDTHGRPTDASMLLNRPLYIGIPSDEPPSISSPSKSATPSPGFRASPGSASGKRKPFSPAPHEMKRSRSSLSHMERAGGPGSSSEDDDMLRTRSALGHRDAGMRKKSVKPAKRMTVQQQEEERAAVTVQSCYRGHLVRRSMSKSNLLEASLKKFKKLLSKWKAVNNEASKLLKLGQTRGAERALDNAKKLMDSVTYSYDCEVDQSRISSAVVHDCETHRAMTVRLEGMLAFERENPALALEKAFASYKIERDLNNTKTFLNLNMFIASVLSACNRHQQALDFSEKAIKIIKSGKAKQDLLAIDLKQYYSICLNAMAVEHMAMGNYNEALECSSEAVNIGEKFLTEKAPKVVEQLRFTRRESMSLMQTNSPKGRGDMTLPELGGHRKSSAGARMDHMSMIRGDLAV